MPTKTWNGQRTTISVRLGDADLQLLDQLVELKGKDGRPKISGMIDGHQRWWHLPKRGDVLRAGLRELAKQHGLVKSTK